MSKDRQRVFASLRAMETRHFWKNRFFRLGFALLAFETLSGTWLYFRNSMNHVDLMLLLGHFLLGNFIWLSTIYFFIRHWRYRKLSDILFRRQFDLLGAGTFLFLFTSALTGTWLFIENKKTPLKWQLHLWSSYAGIFALIFYVIFIVKFVLQGLSQRQQTAFVSMIKRIVLFVSVCTTSLFLILFLSGYNLDLKWKKSIITYQKQAKLFSDSESCAQCHADIYKQWSSSTHKNTPNNFVFASMNLILKEEVGNKNKLYNLNRCVACHAPVNAVTRNVSPDTLRPLKNKEGISCLSCHRIDHITINPGAGMFSYDLNKSSDKLFESQNKTAVFFNNSIINLKPENHKKNYSNSMYSKPEYCFGCHNRLQYTSWQEGPYNRGTDKVKAKTCQDCHMPQVVSHDDVSGEKKGTVADHRFISAGLSMAALYKETKQFDDTKKFMADKKMAMEIIAPEKMNSSSPLMFSIRIGNIGVGHMFPSGPEGDLIEAWPAVLIKDQNGKKLYSNGELDSKNYLKNNVKKIYRILPFDEHKKPIGTNRHRSWKFVMDKKHVINPREYDELQYQISLKRFPASTTKLIIETSLNYRKPNQEYADWVFGNGKFIVPSVVMASATAEIELSSSNDLVMKAQKAWKERLKAPGAMKDLKKKSLEFEIEYKVPVQVKTINGSRAL